MRPALMLRLLAALLILVAALSSSAARADALDIESSLTVAPPGAEPRQTSLAEAMTLLNVPSVSVALINQDRIVFARAYGEDATPETLFQAASMSKLVAAIGALRLVDDKVLALDEDVNAKLTTWKVPANELDRDHPVTLRGLLSTTAGIGVPSRI